MSDGEPPRPSAPGGSLTGIRALLLLAWLRARARVRNLRSDLRRPKRIVLMLLVLGVVVMMVFSSSQRQRVSRSDGGITMIGAFLMLLPLLSLWTAMRQGVLAFPAEEVHFLFPAPVTTRALLLSHLVNTLVKSFTGALVFALFMPRPGGGSMLSASLGYGLYLACCVALQIAVDLACLGRPQSVRRARARIVLLVVLAALGAAVALAFRQDGGQWLGWTTLRHAVLPMLPFASVIAGGAMPGTLPFGLALTIILVVLAGLCARILAYRGDVREAAHKTSLAFAEKLRSVRAGRALVDAPREHTRGTLLPMLPHLRGAGVHAWRQLSVLLRTRKSYALLLLMTIAVGAGMSAAHELEPIALASAMLGVLVFAGPMYVQCDFRSDFECLAWLRTLPTPPGILAAGQIMASAIVLYLFQLLLTGWVMVLCPPEQRLLWIGIFVTLPVFDLLELSVWNGAHLISPLRPGTSGGTPGAATVVRLYLTMGAVFLTTGLAVLIAALFGAGAFFGLKAAGIDNLTLLRVVAGLAGLVALVAVTAVCIWCVGRIFLRVDPSRDLAA